MIPAATRKLKRHRVQPHRNGHAQTPLKIDLGCGPNKREGFLGVDAIAFPSVDIVHDLRKRWPWGDETVSEIHSSHFMEHLTAMERVHFVNELHRVLKPPVFKDGQLVEGFATIVVPHWNSCRAYGDPTHQWPPVSEFFFQYLNREWRLANAAHTDVEYLDGGFDCDLNAGWGWIYHPQLQARNEEYKQYAVTWFKEAIQDMWITVSKRVPNA